MNDIISQVKYDELSDKLIYDKDIVSNKIEIFKHNYHEIMEEIKNLNKDVNVVLIGLDKSLPYLLYTNCLSPSVSSLITLSICSFE
jgi:hypothetical protein